jgi:hypothetical protein
VHEGHEDMREVLRDAKKRNLAKRVN